LRCVDFVYDELQRIVNLIEVTELKRFDSLREKIIEVVNDMLREFKKPTREMIIDLVSMEIDYLNTNHPDFIGGGSAIAKIKARALAAAQNQDISEDEAERARQKQRDIEMYQKAQREAMEMQRIEEERRSKNQNQAQVSEGWSWNSLTGGIWKSKPEVQEQTYTSAGRSVDRENALQNENSPSSLTRPLPVVQPIQNNHLQRVPVSVIPKNQVQRSENEDFQMELICELLESYFKIVKKTVKDRVPKTIMYFLVNKSKEDIQNVLVQELYKEDLLESLLQESDDIAQRREQFSQNITVLTSAQRILNEIIDFKL